jgi:hypothetical protein
MRWTRISLLTAAAACLAAAPPLPAAAKAQDADRKATQAPGESSVDRLGPAIAKRIAGKASLDDVRIEATWRRKTEIVGSRVYGNGVGIWRDRTQFHLSREQVLDLLRAFEKARFSAMPKQFGSDEESEDEEEREKDEAKEKTFFQGTIGLRIGSDQKRVAQTTVGEQSAAFRDLARKIIAVSEEAAATGVGASSLFDGLSKVAAGKLAPETLQILVQRNAGRPGANPDASSWILRIDGRRVVDRTTTPDGKSSAQRLLTLPEEDFRKLAEILSGADPQSFPRNLYSAQYVHLVLRVLAGRADFTARPFAGMTAETHGAKQAAFDRVDAALSALHERVAKDGADVSASAE